MSNTFFPCEASNFETHPRIYWIVPLPSSSGEWRFLGIFKKMQNPGDDYYWEGGWGGRPNEFLIQRRKNTYHLESRWLNSHVLVYHIPLLSHLFGGCAIYFPDGIIMFCYTTSSFMANSTWPMTHSALSCACEREQRNSSKGEHHTLQDIQVSYWPKLQRCGCSRLFQKGVMLVKYMDVSENSGTPKSSILIGFSIINHPFWGTPLFGNTHMVNKSKHKSLVSGKPWISLWTSKRWNHDISKVKFLTTQNREILLMVQKSSDHQLIWRISNFLQGFIHPRWCRISSINSRSAS